jgi:hypothetical protein
MTVRISGSLKSATGINISEGPPERDDLKEVVEGPAGPPGPDEVWIGPDAPTDPATEMWYDTDDGSLRVKVNGSWVQLTTGGGVPAEQNYTHHQSIPSAVWTITHPLAFQPNVTVTDSAGEQVEGEIDYTTGSIITVSFSAAFSGTAFLS